MNDYELCNKAMQENMTYNDVFKIFKEENIPRKCYQEIIQSFGFQRKNDKLIKILKSLILEIKFYFNRSF